MNQPPRDTPRPMRRDDQQITLPPVQAAEEIVSAAWIRELISAVDDANEVVRACLQVRKRALAVLREALGSEDPYRICKAQTAMEAAVGVLAGSIATRDGVKDLLARERNDRPWSEWLRLRRTQ